MSSTQRAWIFEDALSFWAEHGVDRRHGGFFEELANDGSSSGFPFKRVRVICRQIGARLAAWRGAVGDGFRLFVQASSPAGRGMGALLSRDGAITDSASVLYDLAFVILALAWRFRASGDFIALQPERRCATSKPATRCVTVVIENMRQAPARVCKTRWASVRVGLDARAIPTIKRRQCIPAPPTHCTILYERVG
jgi:hypothetical protein